MKPTISSSLRTLQTGLFLILVLTFSLNAGEGVSSGSSLEANIKLNPDCKIKRMSNGTVVVSAMNKEGNEVKHNFTDFYADLLMAAYRKQNTIFILDSFSRKYYLSEDDCRREIKHALNVLAEWNIVLRDNPMASR
jgi:hypothetical protein